MHFFTIPIITPVYETVFQSFTVILVVDAYSLTMHRQFALNSSSRLLVVAETKCDKVDTGLECILHSKGRRILTLLQYMDYLKRVRWKTYHGRNVSKYLVAIWNPFFKDMGRCIMVPSMRTYFEPYLPCPFRLTHSSRPAMRVWMGH